MNSAAILLLGFALLLAGFLLPFLMVLGTIEAGFAVSLLAHFSSVIGLVVTLYGIFASMDSTTRRHRWNSPSELD